MNHDEHDAWPNNECDVCNALPKKLRDFFVKLDIPIINSLGMNGQPSTRVKVNGKILYDILMDEEKLKVLVSKLRNKAFW
jgi:hypothetical protein